jgi:transformer-2 protein
MIGEALNIRPGQQRTCQNSHPGRYYGPPKRHERDRGHGEPLFITPALSLICSSGLTMADRMYDPRPYDTRYTRRPDDRDRDRDRFDRERYDDYRPDDRRYDRYRRSRYDDRRY